MLPLTSNEMASSLKSLHASLKHLTFGGDGFMLLAQGIWKWL